MSNVEPIQKNLIQWFAEQKAESGISDQMADNAGLSLHVHDPAGFAIPYADMGGLPLKGYYRVRVRPGAGVVEASGYPDGPDSSEPSKYWQPKGLGQRLYWPPVLGVNHVANLNGITTPLFITEGEKKALRLQASLLALGLQASVVGLPGVRLGQELCAELKALTMSAKAGSSTVHRPVWLVLDWNDRGEPERDTRAAEDRLQDLLLPLGASLFALRWPTPQGAGVQKIDDWLVAGGDLQAAISDSVDADVLGSTELRRQLLGMNRNWAMLNGRFVRIDDGPNRATVLPKTEFLNETNQFFVWDDSGKRPKKLYVNKEWIEWAGHRTIAGFTCIPPALGEAPEPFVGDRLNTCQGWAPCTRLSPWDEPDFTMIETLLRNFCEAGEHFVWLCQHIAHMFRFPHVMTSQIVLLCGGVGTGKSMLLSTFLRLASEDRTGGLARSIRLDRKDDFNSELEGVVVACYEEPSKTQGGKDTESLIKNLSGVDVLSVRKMRSDAYSVPNYIHLFVAMNLRYLTHTDRNDRRCNFFEAKQNISVEAGNGFGKQYDEWFRTDPQALATWHEWVYSVDLTGYSPQVLGPVSAARLKAIGFSSTSEEDFFSHEMFEDKQVWTNPEIQQAWQQHNPRSPLSDKKLSLLCIEHWGDTVRVVNTGSTTVRMRSTRPGWAEKAGREWAQEAAKSGAKF